MRIKVPLSELEARMKNFVKRMDAENPEWEMALIMSKVNLYYFTGTMQDGILLIPRGGRAVFRVRRSFERALDESLFPYIRPMESYRDASGDMRFPKAVHLESEIVPLAVFQRLQKYFGFTQARALDRQVAAVRARKSEYELALMFRSGEGHRRVLEERVPLLLKEGMTEADLSARLFAAMMEEGHHGVARFGMFDTEMLLGNVAFGESSIYPTYFNGPGGNLGLGPAVPLGGSRDRRLGKGDLVFIDIGFGYEGYHTDKTMTYVFGGKLPDKAYDIHLRCVELQDEMASLLRPGSVPAEIYERIINGLDEGFLKNFMGYKDRRVKFLGHGIGLQIDELPVIAEGFAEPLEEGMVFALEPKAGVEGVGMVGIENTFLTATGGGRCITGDSRGLITV